MRWFSFSGIKNFLFLFTFFLIGFSIFPTLTFAITPSACAAAGATCLGGATATCTTPIQYLGTCFESNTPMGPCCLPAGSGGGAGSPCIGANLGQNGVCQSASNCNSANTDTSANCGANLICCSSSSSGGLGSACGTGGTCLGQSCSALGLPPVIPGTCSSGLSCCGSAPNTCLSSGSPNTCETRPCTNLGKVDVVGKTCSPAGFCCAPTTSGGACLSSGSPNTCETQPCANIGKVAVASGTCSPAGFCCAPNTALPPNIQAITFTNLLQYNTVDQVLGSILTWLQGILATLALIFIVIGGFLYITSGGDTGRVETAKKCIGAAVIGFAIAIAAPSFLREISTILGWGPASSALPPGVGTSLTIVQILTNTLNFLLSIIGVIAIIMLVVGGVMYLTSAGDEDQIDRAKGIVKYSIIGIFIALVSLVIVTQAARFFQ